MSKVWKGIKKAFKSVFKVVLVVVAVVVIAAAIYFTAGAAASAFPSAAGFFGGIQSAAGAFLKGVGAVWKAGAAAFQSAFGGGAAATTAGSSTAVSGGIAGGGAATAANSAAIAGGTASTAGGGAAAGAAVTAGGGSVAGGVAGSTGGGFLAGMTTAEKLALGATVANGASGLMAPTPDEEAEAAAKFRGAFYGRYADGSGGGSYRPIDTSQTTVNDSSPFQIERPAPAPTPEALFKSNESLAIDPGQTAQDSRQVAIDPRSAGVNLFESPFLNNGNGGYYNNVASTQGPIRT